MTYRPSRYLIGDMLNFNMKLDMLLAYAMSVINEENPEAPWYGPWGLVLTRMIDSGEHLVLFPQPRFRATSTRKSRVPDFDVAEVVLNEMTHGVSRRSLIIVEVKAPIAPHNIGGSPENDRTLKQWKGQMPNSKPKWRTYSLACQHLIM